MLNPAKDRLLGLEQSITRAAKRRCSARCSEKMRTHSRYFLPISSSFGSSQRHQYERVPFSFSLLVFETSPICKCVCLETSVLFQVHRRLLLVVFGGHQFSERGAY